MRQQRLLGRRQNFIYQNKQGIEVQELEVRRSGNG